MDDADAICYSCQRAPVTSPLLDYQLLLLKSYCAIDSLRCCRALLYGRRLLLCARYFSSVHAAIWLLFSRLRRDARQRRFFAFDVVFFATMPTCARHIGARYVLPRAVRYAISIFRHYLPRRC